MIDLIRPGSYGWIATWFDTQPQSTVCLGSFVYVIDIYEKALVSSMWLVSIDEKLKWFSRRTLSQAGLLTTTTASVSSRANIGLVDTVSGQHPMLQDNRKAGCSYSDKISLMNFIGFYLFNHLLYMNNKLQMSSNILPFFLNRWII